MKEMSNNYTFTDDIFDTKTGCALAITKAFDTFDKHHQTKFQNKVHEKLQELSMFSLLQALSHQQMHQLYIEMMKIGANINNQSIKPQPQNYNLLLSLPRAIWPCVGKFLTRYETAQIKVVHSKIAIDTDLRSYILGRRSISGNNDMLNDELWLEAENAFRFCQSTFKPQKIRMELYDEFSQHLRVSPLRNIFKYVHEIEIDCENHKMLPLIPFDTIHNWSKLTLHVECAGDYNLSIYDKLNDNLTSLSSSRITNAMIGEFCLHDFDGETKSMMALVKALNGKIERFTLDQGCLELDNVTDLQCVFGKGLTKFTIHKRASFYDGIKRTGTQQQMNELISCDLSTITIEHSQDTDDCKDHVETITMLHRHNILYNVTSANIDLTLRGDNSEKTKISMSEWLCVLIDPIWAPLRCPHLRLVNINTTISNSKQLQALIDEIKPLAKFHQYPILIEEMQIFIEIENYQYLKDCELSIENEFIPIRKTPYSIGTQEQIYNLCELLASKQHVYNKKKYGKDSLKTRFGARIHK